MNLKYVIMWFEDSRAWVEASRGAIERYLQDLGFSPVIVRQPSGKRSLQIIKKLNPDLILIDLNLAGKSKGQDIVEKIRNNELYTDVVFYSQHTDFLEEVGKLEGVFYCVRDELENKTKKIIDITVKREQDVNNLRGLLIAEAIDLERRMESFITSYFGLSKNNEKRPIFEKLYVDNLTLENKYEFACRIFKRAIARLQTKLQTARQNKNQERVVELTVALESLKSKKEMFDRFEADIIKVRNIMAHVEEVAGEKNVLHIHDKDGNLIVVTDDYCNKRRKSVGEHSTNFQKMISDVKRVNRA